jgi:large subunit ribosomal protein L22
MTGPKLNEGALLIDETQVATKATARYLKGSATKARQVLDLIRGLDVRRADEVLQFTDRGAAQEVRKVLASAVANAVHNDNQDADELFVLACFADEGPTLKRFRPRARGRASRIRKRTCHITVIVARMSDSRLEVVQARQEKSAAAGGRRVGTSAQSRRDRVARSRARAESLRGGETVEGAEAVDVADDELVEDELVEDADAVDVADDEVVESADAVDVADDEVAEEALEDEAVDAADEAEGAEDESSTLESAEVADDAHIADQSDETDAADADTAEDADEENN